MNGIPNAASWSNLPGDSPAFYDQFFGPLFFEPYAFEVVKRIDPGFTGVVLEIAAGTGRVTRHLREHIAATATLIASDISKDMLAQAKKQLAHLAIEWQHIDAAALPFNDNSIDLVVCCFGYMFVLDKPKAFAEACRVLKPGGLLLFTTWDKLEQNAISYISITIAKQYLEDTTQPPANLAGSMSDTTVIQSLLLDAGFSKLSIEKIVQQSVSPTAIEAANGLVKGGPYYKRIMKQNPASIDEIEKKIETALAERFGAAPMIAPISAVIARAWK